MLGSRQNNNGVLGHQGEQVNSNIPSRPMPMEPVKQFDDSEIPF